MKVTEIATEFQKKIHKTKSEKDKLEEEYKRMHTPRTKITKKKSFKSSSNKNLTVPDKHVQEEENVLNRNISFQKGRDSSFSLEVETSLKFSPNSQIQRTESIEDEFNSNHSLQFTQLLPNNNLSIDPVYTDLDSSNVETDLFDQYYYEEKEAAPVYLTSETDEYHEGFRKITSTMSHNSVLGYTPKSRLHKKKSLDLGSHFIPSVEHESFFADQNDSGDDSDWEPQHSAEVSVNAVENASGDTEKDTEKSTENNETECDQPEISTIELNETHDDSFTELVLTHTDLPDSNYFNNINNNGTPTNSRNGNNSKNISPIITPVNEKYMNSILIIQQLQAKHNKTSSYLLFLRWKSLVFPEKLDFVPKKVKKSFLKVDFSENLLEVSNVSDSDVVNYGQEPIERACNILFKVFGALECRVIEYNDYLNESNKNSATNSNNSSDNISGDSNNSPLHIVNPTTSTNIHNNNATLTTTNSPMFTPYKSFIKCNNVKKAFSVWKDYLHAIHKIEYSVPVAIRMMLNLSQDQLWKVFCLFVPNKKLIPQTPAVSRNLVVEQTVEFDLHDIYANNSSNINSNSNNSVNINDNSSGGNNINNRDWQTNDAFSGGINQYNITSTKDMNDSGSISNNHGNSLSNLSKTKSFYHNLAAYSQLHNNGDVNGNVNNSTENSNHNHHNHSFYNNHNSSSNNINSGSANSTVNNAILLRYKKKLMDVDGLWALFKDLNVCPTLFSKLKLIDYITSLISGDANNNMSSMFASHSSFSGFNSFNLNGAGSDSVRISNSSSFYNTISDSAKSNPNTNTNTNINTGNSTPLRSSKSFTTNSNSDKNNDKSSISTNKVKAPTSTSKLRPLSAAEENAQNTLKRAEFVSPSGIKIKFTLSAKDLLSMANSSNNNNSSYNSGITSKNSNKHISSSIKIIISPPKVTMQTPTKSTTSPATESGGSNKKKFDFSPEATKDNKSTIDTFSTCTTPVSTKVKTFSNNSTPVNNNGSSTISSSNVNNNSNKSMMQIRKETCNSLISFQTFQKLLWVIAIDSFTSDVNKNTLTEKVKDGDDISESSEKVELLKHYLLVMSCTKSRSMDFISRGLEKLVLMLSYDKDGIHKSHSIL